MMLNTFTATDHYCHPSC